MNFNKLREENKTLKKKIKNLKRTKLRLKHKLNNEIQILKEQLKTQGIGYNWESLECEKKI